MLTSNKCMSINAQPFHLHLRNPSSTRHGSTSPTRHTHFNTFKRPILNSSFTPHLIRRPLQSIYKSNQKPSLIITSSTTNSQGNNSNSYNASDDTPIFEPLTEVASIPFKKLLCANRGEIAIRY